METKLKIDITIFSYQRKEMLESLLQEIAANSILDNCIVNYRIIDDGSDYKLEDLNFIQFEHGGKGKFWRLWDYALKQVENVEADLFLFTPTDYSLIDFERIIKLHLLNYRSPYIYNTINDGRTNCWNLKKPIRINEETMQVGFTDCGFFCNKLALDRIGYYIEEININRFEFNKEISSGVGQVLTFRANKNSIRMFLPYKSLAFHGNHLSLMHPTERLKRPLISK